MFSAALIVLFIRAELFTQRDECQVVDPGQRRSSGSGIINLEPRDLSKPRETGVSDVIFLAIGLGFFVAAAVYLFACERL